VEQEVGGSSPPNCTSGDNDLADITERILAGRLWRPHYHHFAECV